MFRLTVQDAVVLHLYKYAERPIDVYNMPLDTTQDGIATALGISRAHACFELKKLTEKGWVGFIAAHTPGSPRKMMTYYLMPSGLSAIPDIYGRMRKENMTEESLFAERHLRVEVKDDH